MDNAGCAIYCSACLFCDKGCQDGGGTRSTRMKALLCFVFVYSVMSVVCEDSLISHKGWL